MKYTKKDFKEGEIVEIKLSLLNSILENPIPSEQIWQKHTISKEDLGSGIFLDFLIEYDMIRKI